jgi:hypothetical protein
MPNRLTVSMKIMYRYFTANMWSLSLTLHSRNEPIQFYRDPCDIYLVFPRADCRMPTGLLLRTAGARILIDKDKGDL